MGSILTCLEVDVDTKVKTAVVTSAAVAGVMVEAHAKYTPIRPSGANENRVAI